MMLMNWDAIGAVSDVISALFVGVTIIYLGIQLHQNTRASRAEALNTAIGTHVRQMASMTGTLESASLFRRFTEDLYALSLDERGVAQAMMLERTASFNQVVRLHRAGLLEAVEFAAMRGTYISVLKTTGGRQWWAAYKHMVPRDLNDYVSKVLDDPTVPNKPYTEELPWLFLDEKTAATQPQSGSLT